MRYREDRERSQTEIEMQDRTPPPPIPPDFVIPKYAPPIQDFDYENYNGRIWHCEKCGNTMTPCEDGRWHCFICEYEEQKKEEEAKQKAVKDQDYYTRNGYRARDLIRDLLKYLGLEPWESWVVGTAFKYICRYPFKGDRNQDLAKAQEYLEWLKEKE